MTNSPNDKKVINSEVFFDELVNEDVNLNDIPIQDEEEKICSLMRLKWILYNWMKRSMQSVTL